MNSMLAMTLRRDVADQVVLTIAVPGRTMTKTLDGIDEHQLGDALRQIDRIATGANPGPCEQWIAQAVSA
jgi:hypothetical protein